MTSYPAHDGPGGRRRRRPRRGAPDAATGFPGSPEFPGAPFAGPAFHHDPPEDGPFGHHRGHRRGRFGPGGFGPGGFGPGGFGPGYGPRGRGRGRGRGDVRAAILVLLAEQPRHGYELIQEISERSSGFWTPSPGSVYPTLQALEDEGLVTITSVEGRRTAALTDAGRAYVEANRETLGEPWAAPGDLGPALALRQEALAARNAVAQVARVGTPAQLTKAAAILATARKGLYRILAEDTPES